MKNIKFEKYKYLGNVYPNVSKYWQPIVFDMIKKIDKQVKPWYIPRFILNYIYFIATRNSVVSIKNKFWFKIFKRIIPITIIDIKDKFAELRVYGFFTEEVEEIIDDAVLKCESICERCGSTDNVSFWGDHWIYLCCEKCISLNNNKNN